MTYLGDIDLADLTDEQRDALEPYVHGDGIVALDAGPDDGELTVIVTLESGAKLRLDHRGRIDRRRVPR